VFRKLSIACLVGAGICVLISMVGIWRARAAQREAVLPAAPAAAPASKAPVVTVAAAPVPGAPAATPIPRPTAVAAPAARPPAAAPTPRPPAITPAPRPAAPTPTAAPARRVPGVPITAPALKSKPLTPEQLKAMDVGQTCGTADCHVEFNRLRFRHGPTAQGKCEPCHVSLGGKHVFKQPDPTNDLCLICHEAVPRMKVAHPPVRDNCRECHDVHGENDRFFLKGNDVADLCNRCHEDVKKGLQFVHGPLDQGLCLACHEPHESDVEDLLIAPKGEFCAVCHEDLATQAETALAVHQPFRDDCMGCHSGHGGQIRYFLRAPAADLCRQCHQETIDKAKTFKFQHEPIAKGERCSDCHTSHYSDYEGLLKQASSDLCLQCHDRVYEHGKGKQVDNIKEKIETAKFLHGPIRDKNCMPCHSAHGSEFVSLLNRDFPARFYANFSSQNYELCWFCHDQTVVLEPESLDTGFRNGQENMHHLHVNREKGRTCRACHAEHASNNPVHIRDSVPYGQWQMEIQFEKTPTGGSCATGCHARYAYDRDSPVKNIVSGQ